MSPRTHRFVCLLAAAVALLPAVAHAASPGVGHGTMMLSAERLFGLSNSRITTGSGNGEVAQGRTELGVALSPASQIYVIPRLAFDLAVIDGLTVGGSLGLVVGGTNRSTTNNNGVTTDTSGPTFTTFLIAPRVGYVLGLGPVLNLWLRGGFSYFNRSSSTDINANSSSTGTTWGMSINLEPTLLIAPLPHVGFTVSGVIDLPLAGQQSIKTTVGSVTTTVSTDSSIRNLGVLAGMVVMF